MRNVVKISFLAAVLFLFGYSRVLAFFPTPIRLWDDIDYRPSVSYPARVEGEHWDSILTHRKPECDSVNAYYAKKGVDAFKEQVYFEVELGSPYGVADVLSCTDKFSRQEKNLLLGFALEKAGKRALSIADNFEKDRHKTRVDMSGVIRSLREEAVDDFRLADKLIRPYLGTPGGL